MKRILPALLALTLIAIAHAEIRDSGVMKKTDEFTGAVSCSQIVVNTQDPYYLATTMYQDAAADIFMITRSDLKADEVAHNMFMAQQRDLLYLRFNQDDVENYKIMSAKADVLEGTTGWQSQTGILADTALFERLVSAPGDVRYRISSDSNFDGTIIHEQLAAHRAFIAECLN